MKKIYELMESILIRGFLALMNNQPIEISDTGVYTESKWLTKESKTFLLGLDTIKDDSKKVIDIKKIYSDTESFENFITFDENGQKKVIVNDLKQFREKINELLNILPFPIYISDR